MTKRDMFKYNDLNIKYHNAKNENKELKYQIEDMKKSFEKQMNDMNKKFNEVCDQLAIANKTIVKLKDEIKELKKTNISLKDDLKKANATITDLKARLNKDSNNSSKPPSSDGFKKKIHNRRIKTDKSIGGQLGHAGKRLTFFENPTNIIDKQIKTCTCGGSVGNHVYLSKKQLVDIRVLVDITEERIYKGYCEKCGKVHTATFSDGYINDVQYGNHLKALTTMLLNEGMVSINRIKDIISSLTNNIINLSEGTIVNFNSSLSSKSEALIEEIKNNLIKANIINCDETGVRINGKLNWLHTVTNDSYTYYANHKKRGIEAMNDMEILTYFVGTMIHDHWKSYYDFNQMTHSECNSHIIRYIEEIIDIFNRKGAKEFLEFLINLNNEKKDAVLNDEKCFSENILKEKEDEYIDILNRWQEEFLEYAKDKTSKCLSDERNLIKRLIEYKQQHLEFIRNFDVSFDNNLAERALRMIKAKIKISGGFRSEGGAIAFANIRSIISTAKKQKKNVFNTIKNIFDNDEVILEI